MTRIVEMKDTRPLTIKAQDLEDGPISICRCGLSANWPYCDSSHAKTRDEENGRLYKYGRDDRGSDLEQAEVDGPVEGADPRPWITFEGSRP